jgi:hypothetical protein
MGGAEEGQQGVRRVEAGELTDPVEGEQAVISWFCGSFLFSYREVGATWQGCGACLYSRQ